LNGLVLVTGASGVLGRAIVSALSDAGVAVRREVRNAEKATPGTGGVRLNYTDSATFASAMNGARGLVLMAPPLDGEAPAKLAPVVAQAKSSGIQHIVFHLGLWI
jgi:NAD(P)H dehydrogenase (quinone)